MELPATSFLSPHVRHILLCGIGKTISAGRDQTLLLKDDLLCWTSIDNFLPDGFDSPEYFVNCVQCLAGGFNEAQKRIESWSVYQFQEKYGGYLQWTGHVEVILRSFEILQNNTSTSAVVSMLMTTSVLERALGNVFLLKGKVCPSLLKDLLVSTELLDILGGRAIKLLRVLIGPPVSLNLRNVLWHGFAVPAEIPRCYAYFLILLIPSLGQLLLDRSVDPNIIPYRPEIKFLQIEYWDTFPDIIGEDCAILSDLFQASEFISQPMLPYWAAILDSYKFERYGEAVVILLPQLEHCLRCLFSTVNQCPERILTAESTTLYTTINEILSRCLPDGSENKLRYAISDSYMDILFDLLIYPEGPRVRDRVSHGEANLLDIKSKLAGILLCVCSALSLKGLEESKRSRFLQNPLLQKIFMAAETYTSQCHSVSGLERELQSLCDKLSEWINFPKPVSDQGVEAETYERTFLPSDLIQQDGRQVSGLPSVDDFQPWLSSCQLPLRFLYPFEDISPIVKVILKRKLSTLYRGQDSAEKSSERTLTESELVGLLRRIAVQASAASFSLKMTMYFRYQQWVNRELRSRQRKNYTKMIQSVPVVSMGLRLVALLIASLLLNLDALTLLDSSQQLQISRHLKSVLQYCENLTSNTSKEKNKWDESCILVQDLALNIMEKKNLYAHFLNNIDSMECQGQI